MNHTFTVTPHLVETQVLCLYTSKKLTHSSSHNATNSNHNCNFLTGPINYTPFLVNRVHLVLFHPSHQDTKSCICECISIVWFFWLWLVSEHVTLLVFKTVDVIISIILSIQTSRLEPQTKLSLTTSTNPTLPELVLLLSPFQCISQFDWPGVNVELWVVFADVGLQ